MEVHEFAPEAASDDELQAWYALDAALEQEQVGPDLPVTPYEESLAWLLHQPATRPVRHWVVRDGDTVVGTARLAWWTNQADLNADLTLGVAADHRRRGIGRALLRTVATAARESGRDLAGFEIVAGSPGEPFVTTVGAQRRMVERRSLCRTAEVDVELLRRWVAKAPTEDYELVHWRGAAPDDWAADLARVKESINDAPTDDLAQGRIDFDVSVVRADEAGAARREQEPWKWCAVHHATGRLVGATEMLVPSRWPAMAYQEGTAVDPAHRERGIGRWIKGALMLALLDARPSTEWVQTWNAGSNAAMLGINVEMGFRPAEEWGVWQVPVADVLSQLGEQ